MIQIESICKDYTRGRNVVHALHPTSMNFNGGEFIAIVGPSGSGKSTLLSMIGGMLSPTSGRVVVNGQSLYEINVKQRSRLRNEQIGFLFQSFNLISYLNAIENVQLPMTVYGTDRANQQNQAKHLLERFGLGERLDHKPSELSAGQQQRVAMARTLAMGPNLILADEPTGNLDPESRDLILRTLHELCEEGRTIILVTHDMTVSASAHRVFHIDDGYASEATQNKSRDAA
ncbi:MAG: ABC transporter ATP-binding protein [Planctomycetaceae bacterium]|nr:ABC transporter ATP-binding protein [Planctomycetaceae bacterium]